MRSAFSLLTILAFRLWLSTTSAAMAKVRKERDTFGELEVPADKYYGAQTARFVKRPCGCLTGLMPKFKVVDELQNWWS